MLRDRRQEGRATTDDDRVAEQTQLVDEAEPDRCRGGLLSQRCRGEPSVALNAVERAAEDDLRDGAPNVGERGPSSLLRIDGSVSHGSMVS